MLIHTGNKGSTVAQLQRELKAAGWYDKTWQAFAVILPTKSVGVMGDERTYDNTICLRCVDSVDGMTADWSRLPHDLLASIAKHSGGKVINDAAQLAEVLRDVPMKVGSPIVKKTPLWSTWWLWTWLLGLLSVEWIWRRVVGLA